MRIWLVINRFVPRSRLLNLNRNAESSRHFLFKINLRRAVVPSLALVRCGRSLHHEASACSQGNVLLFERWLAESARSLYPQHGTDARKCRVRSCGVIFLTTSFAGRSNHFPNHFRAKYILRHFPGLVYPPKDVIRAYGRRTPRLHCFRHPVWN
jgi:hypothetical protein